MTTSLKEHTALLNERINKLLDVLVKNYASRNGNSQYYHKDHLTFEVVPGTKYLKIVMSDHGSKSVHAFVHRQTGCVYKPASWRAPAKHVRYQLLDDASFEQCLKRADWAGGYLYL
jgi:hypothetical protein